MPEEEQIKVARDWGTPGRKFKPSEEMKRLKKKTGSYYKRDQQVEPYEVRNGKYV